MADNSEAQTIFLLMPFHESFHWLWDEIVQVAGNLSVRVERADDISKPGAIFDQVQDAIATADAVGAVLTGNNPNVFFELGLAWRWHNPVLLVEDPSTLPFDVRHLRMVVYGRESASRERLTLRPRLKQALQEALSSPTVARGRRRSSVPEAKTVASLDVRVMDAGKSHRLEIVNRGTVPVSGITVEFPEGSNWQLQTDTFASYPIRELRPGRSIRALLFAGHGLGGSLATEVRVRGSLPDGDEYEDSFEVSSL